MAEVPLELPTGRVVGKFIFEVQDNRDPGEEPQLVPVTGDIIIKSSIDNLSIFDQSLGKFITFRGPHKAIINSLGELATPDQITGEPMYTGMSLWSNDSDKLSVKGWTYTATFNLKTADGKTLNLPPAIFTLATGQVVDLADVIRVPATPGYGLPQAEGAALRAEAAAQVALDVKAMAEAGELDGEKGDVGPMGPPVALEIGTVSASAGNPADDDIMSTLILSGTKTQAAIKAQIPIEQIGEQGPKGDPGGWTTAAPLGTADLDTIKTPGLYRVEAAANATLARHYPVSPAFGSLMVYEWGPTPGVHVVQEFKPSGGVFSGILVSYYRTNGGAGWSAWTTSPTMRVDTTVGTRVFITNGVTEHMVSGDTGWRKVDVIPTAPYVLSGEVRYQRINERVYLYFNNVLLDTTGSGYCPIIDLADIPQGFRMIGSERSIQQVGLASNATAGQTIAIFTSIAWIFTETATGQSPVRPTTGLSGSVSWKTNDPWPTSLPGTAV